MWNASNRPSSSELPIVATDFTHTYTEDDFPQGVSVSRIDAATLQGTNCYCDAEAQEALRKLMKPFTASGIHFLDSGNYHYLSKLWTEEIAEPFSLVLFDHHPDMQAPRFEGVLSCGGWVRTMLEENPLLQQVYIIGISPSLVEETEGFGDRVAVLTEHEENLFSTRRKKFFYTRAQKVYLSIDKDVLAATEVSTNWDQGSMTLEALKRQVAEIFSSTEVIGVDVCGENPELADGQRLRRNKAVNRDLCSFLMEQMKKQ